MKAKINEGCIIGQDFRHMKWPECLAPISIRQLGYPSNVAPILNMVFDVNEKSFSDLYELKCEGFGLPGSYGNGSIYISKSDPVGITFVDDNEETFNFGMLTNINKAGALPDSRLKVKGVAAYSVTVRCPECDESFDCISHEYDNEITSKMFQNTIQSCTNMNVDIVCPYCENEMILDSIEY